MSSSTSDRNLLYGILALQMDFISRDALVAAMNTWVLRKETPIGDILREQQAMEIDEQHLLDALVAKHLQKHEHDPRRSLQAVGSIKSVRVDLDTIADPEVKESLCQVAVAPGIDPYATLERPQTVSDSSIRYQVLRPHARGGLGEVFIAHDTEIDREVALKEIQLDKSHHPDSRQRFLFEAKVTGRLEHPGIVPVYGLGHYGDGRPFYAMRFIRGDSLEQAILSFHNPWKLEIHSDHGESKFRVPAAEFTSLEFRQLLGRFIDVCNAIEYAHARGVLHRDLKPENIMLGKYGETLVVDWGLARLRSDTEPKRDSGESIIDSAVGSGSTPTQMGAVVGTPAFMSPEQAAGRLNELGPSTDIYSLGATLYFLITGQAPFVSHLRGADVVDLLTRVQRGDFPRPRAVNRSIPVALEAICLRAMNTKPSERYESATALAKDIERWLADEPVSAVAESLFEQMGRWVRRHRTDVTASVIGTFFVSAILFVAAVLVSAKQEARLAAVHMQRIAELRNTMLEENLESLEVEYLKQRRIHDKMALLIEDDPQLAGLRNHDEFQSLLQQLKTNSAANEESLEPRGTARPE